MPVTELTFSPDPAPSDIPTSVNSAPSPRYFRVDFLCGRQALFGQFLIPSFLFPFLSLYFTSFLLLAWVFATTFLLGFFKFYSLSWHTWGTQHTVMLACRGSDSQLSVVNGAYVRVVVGVSIRSHIKILGIKVYSLKKSYMVNIILLEELSSLFVLFLCAADRLIFFDNQH